MTEAPSARATQAGILLMISASLTFGAQDGLSRLLAESYGPVTVIAIRFWFFALFVLAFAATRPGGIRRVAKSKRPVFQTLRGLLLITQICTAVYGFTMVGLVGYQVIFASYPLMIMALSVPILAESVGWRRWIAVLIGFSGVILILRPGSAMFSGASIMPVLAAFMMASYGLMTRFAARNDSALTSFFWTAIAGGLAMMCIGPFFWDPPVGMDWVWMGLLCLSGTGGHYLLIKALDATKASTTQPFTYLQLVFASSIGVFIFADELDPMLIIGGAIIVGSGLFALQRSRQAELNQS